ncbi:hypothetical protein FBU30_001585 [Linnemannia zychae]|nr:hypothetical protein FBU30_001585 [Linnemannia zychae]
MNKIIIPEDHPYHAYIKHQGVDNLSPISFFQFYHFRSTQKDYAGQEYRKLIALIMQHHTSKGHKLLVGFNTQKQKIAQYWSGTLEQEKQLDHAASVKDQGRIQSLAAVNAVIGDTLQVFGAAGSKTGPLLGFQTEASSTTDTTVTAEATKNPSKKKRKTEDNDLDTLVSVGEHQYDVDEFEAMVSQLDRSRFWKLSCSGRYVEDVLIKAARQDCKAQQLGLYCQRSEPLKANQIESFWRYDVFGMINSLLRDVPDLHVVHGEVASEDTAKRRNRDRTLPTDGLLEREKIGYRCDGLVQVQGHRPLNIGVLEAGPTLLTLFANCPGGYVSRIRPYHAEFKFADSICHFNLNLRILKHLLVTKLILLNSKAIIQEAPVDWDDDDDSEASTTDNSLPSVIEQEVELPPLQSTPTKKRGTRIITD